MKMTALVMMAGLATLLPFESRAGCPGAYDCKGDGTECKPRKDCCEDNVKKAKALCLAKKCTCDPCAKKYNCKSLSNLKQLMSGLSDGDQPTASDCGYKCVKYTNPDGTEETRQGGTLAWRENNPGNLSCGSFAYSNGAIGCNGRWAIFPDYDTGNQAMQNLLTQNYGNSTISQMLYHYAPPSENDTGAYLRYITAGAGVPASTRINSLSASQLSGLANAMKQMEGYKAGTIS